MKRLSYLSVVVIILSSVFLIAFSPDSMSMMFSAVMFAVVLAGIIIGLLPAISVYGGLQRGVSNIENSLDVQSSSAWAAVLQIDNFFHEKRLDRLFDNYCEKIKMQREAGQIMGDIEDYIDSDVIALDIWHNVMQQIPGVLTGLGILGTFVGLLIGINDISFSTMEAAITSVQLLLDGIHLAFYTSIAGVILSILFNMSYNMVWNMVVRELGVFHEKFHKNIIPTVDEQIRYQDRKGEKLILERLDRLPKNAGYSVGASGMSPNAASASQGNEQILMPQILEGLKNGEFTFFLQPRYDLNNRKVVAAEALVRWRHSKLGLVSPAVFMPIMESNGYITRLDQYIWENVCKTLREWIDAGERPVPISLNITKTDMLAISVADFFEDMIKKYRIPPRFLELEIAINAFVETPQAVQDVTTTLRQLGFKVVLDGFGGDFVELSAVPNLNVDEIKLDLRQVDMEKNSKAVKGMFDQARQLHYDMFAEGIETMEQLSLLRKSGCSEGQGYYFSKPISIEEFKELL